MSNLIGQSLGRYHILEQLGEGGMATVYKAYDTRLEADVAVKVIRTENLAPSVLERTFKRFEREAKALARLTHPNIIKVTDYGEYEGKPYLVMEYLPGRTLKQRLGKPIPWQEATRTLLPITRALDFAHRQNIIHRDVKPSNILITADGEPMLTDFGIAKILDLEETQDLTGTGMGIGTPEYMAPEQWKGKTSTLSDQYALGVVFYEMLTGRKPYSADTPAAILLKQATEPLPRPGQFARDLPEKVEKLLLKVLAHNPEDRYASMGEFMTALELVISGVAPSANPHPPCLYEQKEDTKATMLQEGAIIKETPAPAYFPPSPVIASSAEVLSGGTRGKENNRLRYWSLGAISLSLIFCSLSIGLFWVLTRGLSEINAPVAYSNEALTAAAETVTFQLTQPVNPVTSVPTPSATRSDSFLTVDSNTNCREGPDLTYVIVRVLVPRTRYQMIGRTADNRFWIVTEIGKSNPCWVPAEFSNTFGSVNLLPVTTPSAPTFATDALSAPTGLSYQYGCIFDGVKNEIKVVLQWNDSSNNETGFRVYRDGTLVIELPANTTTYTDLFAGNATDVYSYNISAVNTADEALGGTISFSCQ